MISCGITCPSELNTAGSTNEGHSAVVLSPHSLASSHAEESCDVDCKLRKNDNNEEMVSSERSKIDNGNDCYSTIEATQSSIVKFLASYDNGVSSSPFRYFFLTQIVEKCFCKLIFIYDIVAAVTAGCLA